MNKVNVTLVSLVVLFFILNIVQFVVWHKTNLEISESYTQEIANLNATIAKYGTEATVYTVNSAVKAGDPITEDSITTMVSYSSLMTEQYVTKPEDIVGKFFKISVNPGTPIMHDMAMDENLDDSTRIRDVCLDKMTVGLAVGDYIDIRITMPYGDDYVVMSHKRVYSINAASIQLYMTEYEWNVYQGALIDYFLNSAYGCTIYADKYVEPGIQQSAIPFYAVPTNIAALLQKNPNIVDKDAAASLNEWRASIEQLLVIFRDNEDTVDADGSKLVTGREKVNSTVETDRKSAQEAANEEAKAAAEASGATDATGGSAVSDDFWTEDVTDSTQTPTGDEGGSTPEVNNTSTTGTTDPSTTNLEVNN